MARARVILREGITLRSGTRVFLKGKAQILTNASEIERYRMNGRFDVKDLAEEKPKADAKAKADDGKGGKKKGGKKKGKS